MSEPELMAQMKSHKKLLEDALAAVVKLPHYVEGYGRFARYLNDQILNMQSLIHMADPKDVVQVQCNCDMCQFMRTRGR